MAMDEVVAEALAAEDNSVDAVVAPAGDVFGGTGDGKHIGWVALGRRRVVAAVGGEDNLEAFDVASVVAHDGVASCAAGDDEDVAPSVSDDAAADTCVVVGSRHRAIDGVVAALVEHNIVVVGPAADEDEGAAVAAEEDIVHIGLVVALDRAPAGAAVAAAPHCVAEDNSALGVTFLPFSDLVVANSFL